jgi:hypothetical protein
VLFVQILNNAFARATRSPVVALPRLQDSPDPVDADPFRGLTPPAPAPASVPGQCGESALHHLEGDRSAVGGAEDVERQDFGGLHAISVAPGWYGGAGILPSWTRRGHTLDTIRIQSRYVASTAVTMFSQVGGISAPLPATLNRPPFDPLLTSYYLQKSALQGLQRVAQWEPLRMVDEPPLITFPTHAPRQRLPRHRVVLDQHGQLEARLQDSVDDFPKAVAPVSDLVVAELDRGVDIRSRSIEMPGLCLLEVRVAEHQRVGPIFIDTPHHRMAFAQEQPAARA